MMILLNANDNADKYGVLRAPRTRIPCPKNNYTDFIIQYPDIDNIDIDIY